MIKKITSEFSSDFLGGFMRILRLSYNGKRVKANTVYQEYIADKSHTHMNSTRHGSISFQNSISSQNFYKTEKLLKFNFYDSIEYKDGTHYLALSNGWEKLATARLISLKKKIVSYFKCPPEKHSVRVKTVLGIIFRTLEAILASYLVH